MAPQTIRYCAQQLGIGYGVIALFSYLALLLTMALALDTWIWFPFWLGLGAVFTLERVVTVWKGGWRARLLALLLIPELCFDIYLDLVYVKVHHRQHYGPRSYVDTPTARRKNRLESGRILIMALPAGLLLPEALLHSQWFAVWATFVAIDTLMYAALSVSKILPTVYHSEWFHGRNRRTETRSIFPDANV